jgi:hypothetical protein
MLIEDERTFRRVARRAWRHVRWAQAHGVRRLLEEDGLDPVTRTTNAWRKQRWRLTHSVPAGSAVPVYLVGVQRSGTNMVVRGLEASPEVEVRNENDKGAFVRYQLRPDGDVRRLVGDSRHRYVLFKPLCDSHRVAHLLDDLGTASPGRAIWAYRDVEGRVRSALAKFGQVNHTVLAEIAAGNGGSRWQAQGLSEASMDLLRSMEWDRVTPETASALFWYVRNALYFELGLHGRDDVTLVSYGRFVSGPEPTMRALCSFLGLSYDPAMATHIGARSAPHHEALAIDPAVRRVCGELQDRLDAAAGEKLRLAG